MTCVLPVLVSLAYLICNLIFVLCSMQMSGFVYQPTSMNYRNSGRERRGGNQSLPLLSFSGFDPNDRPISISEFLVNMSCRKQSDSDTQDVIIKTSPSITKTNVVSSISTCFFS